MRCREGRRRRRVHGGPRKNSVEERVSGNRTFSKPSSRSDPARSLLPMRNYRGDTVLHIAARAGRICTAELLLGCGGVVDKANDMGNTMFHEAVKSRHYELTHLLLSRGSRSVYQENKEGNCPL
ncbi:hypothetical protein EUGRSUZ_H03478 [Eucalyptus grandis]|uniref:Uncharacterized protein n=2 Tax=Eucalyptus grandis TaxID=71139 RepID=A0ACC3JUY0_EUCGR|nr:hypothetical protein EUGRSUZ_H03478 [Eucalyptus grandis]